MKLKEVYTGVELGELGEERTFVSGTKNWRVTSVIWNNVKYEVGTKVSYFDSDSLETFKGTIEWIIVTERGNIEVSILNPALGRVDLKDLIII